MNFYTSKETKMGVERALKGRQPTSTEQKSIDELPADIFHPSDHDLYDAWIRRVICEEYQKYMKKNELGSKSISSPSDKQIIEIVGNVDSRIRREIVVRSSDFMKTIRNNKIGFKESNDVAND